MYGLSNLTSETEFRMSVLCPIIIEYANELILGLDFLGEGGVRCQKKEKKGHSTMHVSFLYAQKLRFAYRKLFWASTF